MGKQSQSAYVALPMGEAGHRKEGSAEGGSACRIVAKIGVFAALLSLVIVGAMHLGCGGKDASEQASQLRKHRGKQSDSGALASYWREVHHHWSPWGGHRHHHPQHGDLMGPHHVPHGNLLGPDHHRNHDDEKVPGARHADPPVKNNKKSYDMPEVLKHPLYTGKSNQKQGIVKVKVSKKPQQKIQGDMPEVLKHPHYTGQKNQKQNVVKVPVDKNVDGKKHGGDTMPEVLKHPHYTGQPNQKQNVVKVQVVKEDETPAQEEEVGSDEGELTAHEEALNELIAEDLDEIDLTELKQMELELESFEEDVPEDLIVDENYWEFEEVDEDYEEAYEDEDEDYEEEDEDYEEEDEDYEEEDEDYEEEDEDYDEEEDEDEDIDDEAVDFEDEEEFDAAVVEAFDEDEYPFVAREERIEVP